MSEWCSSGADMKKPRMGYSPKRDIFLILVEQIWAFAIKNPRGIVLLRTGRGDLFVKEAIFFFVVPLIIVLLSCQSGAVVALT